MSDGKWKKMISIENTRIKTIYGGHLSLNPQWRNLTVGEIEDETLIDAKYKIPLFTGRESLDKSNIGNEQASNKSLVVIRATSGEWFLNSRAFGKNCQKSSRCS